MATPPTELGRNVMTDTQIRSMVQGMVEQGRATEQLTQLYKENFEYRSKNAQLTAEAEELRKQVPGENDVILTGDDIPLFTEAKALGKNAKDLKAMAIEHNELGTKVKDLVRRSHVLEIAEAEGWHSDVLDRLTLGMDLTGVEAVDEEVDDDKSEGGKKKVSMKRGFVNIMDDSKRVSKKKLVDELVKFIPSLAKGEGEDGSEGKVTGSGTPLPRMTRGDKAPEGDTKGAVQSYLNRKGYGKTREMVAAGKK